MKGGGERGGEGGSRRDEKGGWEEEGTGREVGGGGMRMDQKGGKDLWRGRGREVRRKVGKGDLGEKHGRENGR